MVAEKTGYPVEMLELEMQLDADLGIDSIKRVEILSAIQDRLPDAPAIKPEHLGTLRTLRQIADFLAGPIVRHIAPEHAPTMPAARRNGDLHHAAPAGPNAPDAPAVAEVLLQVVSEKTGYPLDMLELDMQLDGDLGIDSIKRVEILSAIQDRLPHAPAVKPEHLGTLRTLRQIADFLGQPASLTVPAEPQKTAPAAGRNGDHHHPAPAGQASPVPSVAEVLLQVVSEKTGYPVDMLEMEMQLDADLGIDSIKRVEILSAIQDRLPHAPAVKPEHLGTLRTLRQIAGFLEEPQQPAPVEPIPRNAARLTCLVPRAMPLAHADRRKQIAIAPSGRGLAGR